MQHWQQPLCLPAAQKNTIEKRQANLELSSVSTNETKAVIDGTIFPKDGHIGLFLFKDEAAVSPYGDTGCSNVEYSYNGDNCKWTANPPIMVGSESSAADNAFMYSVIESCKLNDIDPGKYISFLLDKLKTSRDGDDLTGLLPCYCGL